MDTLDLIAEFLAAKTAGRRAPTTLREYRRVLRQFAAHQPQLPASAAQVEQYLSSLSVAPISVRAYYDKVKVFLRWCSRRKGIPEETHLIDPPEFDESPGRYYSTKELSLILNHPSHSLRDRSLLALFAEVGIRAKEAHSITKGRLKDGFVIVTTKGRKGRQFLRYVPVTDQVMTLLLSLADQTPGEVLWLGRQGPLTLDGVKKAVRRAVKRAGISGRRLGPHTLRHTFATLWDGDETQGERIGGWTDHRMFRHYRKPLVSVQRQQLQEHSLVKKLTQSASQPPLL